MTRAARASGGLLVFTLPEEEIASILVCGLSLSQVVTVTAARLLEPSVEPRPHVLGIVRYKDAVAPVVDLLAALGLGATDYGRAERLLIARGIGPGAVVALPARADFTQVSELGLFAAVPPEALLNAALLLGLYQFGARLLAVPDLDALAACCQQTGARQAGLKHT